MSNNSLNKFHGTTHNRKASLGAKSKLTKVELVTLMRQVTEKNATEEQCLELFSISQQVFNRILKGEKAYRYLLLTEPYITFNRIIMNDRKSCSVSNAKISANDILILDTLSTTESIKEVSKKLNISIKHINCVLYGTSPFSHLKDTTAWLDMKINYKKNKKFSINKVIKIINTVANSSLSKTKVAEKFKISVTTLHNILKAKSSYKWLLSEAKWIKAMCKTNSLSKEEIFSFDNDIYAIFEIYNNFDNIKEFLVEESNDSIKEKIYQLTTIYKLSTEAFKFAFMQINNSKVKKDEFIITHSMMHYIYYIDKIKKLNITLSIDEIVTHFNNPPFTYNISKKLIKSILEQYNKIFFVEHQQKESSSKIIRVEELENLNEYPFDMLSYIKSKGKTHYVKFPILNDLSIRMHFIWQDRTNMQNVWIVKDHANSKFAIISKEAVDVILQGAHIDTIAFEEIRGMISQGKYIKFSLNSEHNWKIRYEDIESIESVKSVKSTKIIANIKKEYSLPIIWKAEEEDLVIKKYSSKIGSWKYNIYLNKVFYLDIFKENSEQLIITFPFYDELIAKIKMLSNISEKNLNIPSYYDLTRTEQKRYPSKIKE